QSCGGSGTPNVCGCTPSVKCADKGAECGSIDDGCGGALACGTCTADQSCTANKCVANGADLGGGGGTPDLAQGPPHGGGCGCQVGARDGATGPLAFLVIGLAFAAVLQRRRMRAS